VESNPPTRGLSSSPSTRLSLKNPTEWRAILPLGAQLQSKYSPKFQKSYQVESNPPTRGLSCSPSTRLTFKNPTEWRAILPLRGLVLVSFKNPTEWRAILPLGGFAAVQVLA